MEVEKIVERAMFRTGDPRVLVQVLKSLQTIEREFPWVHAERLRFSMHPLMHQRIGYS